MQYANLADSHTHSCFSHDGHHAVAALCDQAIKRGLYALTVTDHCECNLYQQGNYAQAITRSFAETARTATAFAGKLHVYKGVELGQATQNTRAAADILSRCDFDFVLGSMHNLTGLSDFYMLDYRKLSAHDVLCKYFDELEELIAWGHFDSLSHLTYPLRYMVGEQQIEMRYETYQNRVDDILKALIAQDKALELNTSGLRQAIGKTLPCPTVIKRFKELGGKYLTVGSDAHKDKDIGIGLQEGYEIAKNAGFDHVTVFVNRKPVLLPLQEKTNL